MTGPTISAWFALRKLRPTPIRQPSITRTGASNAFADHAVATYFAAFSLGVRCLGRRSAA